MKVSSWPGFCRSAVLQRNWSARVELSWSPTVSDRPWSASTPKRILITSLPSLKIASKLALPERFAYVVRHSTTYCLFGGEPVVAVKMPPLPVVRRSSQ